MDVLRSSGVAFAVLLSLSLDPVARAIAPASAPLTPPAAAPASQPATFFDPSKHMRVAEVRPGMKGYGLSVFQGSTIERFDVEVMSILRNFNPSYDVILIRCAGANLEHTGAIAGMSGSPIYLTDEAGKSRMVGAFAYGWPFAKDPVAGVQPIEYMLDLGNVRAIEKDATKSVEPATRSEHSEGGIPSDRNAAKPQAAAGRWSLSDAGLVPLRSKSNDLFHSSDHTRPTQLTGDAAPRLQPLATPLMTGGVSSKTLDLIGPLLKANGLIPLQAGGGGSSDPNSPSPTIEPGSVLAAPMLIGDLEMTAIGTCTEVVGDRVFGFGHPFNNEGPIALPFGSGVINGTFATITQSFKMGALSKIVGTLTADQQVGIAGRIGKSPSLIPIEFRVAYADGTIDRTYRFQAAQHTKFTPMLSVAALAASVTGLRDLPPLHTIDYAIDLEFAGGRTIRIANVDATTDAGDSAALASLAQLCVVSLRAAGDNPFERVPMTKMTGTFTVRNEAKAAGILSVNVPKSKYRPGETVKAFVTYRTFRESEAVMSVTMDLPKDLPNGAYSLVVGDADRYLMDEITSRPSRFSAENADEVFAAVNDYMAVRHDALYLRLLRQPDGVSVGRVAMPRLPSSKRQVMLGAGRSNTTPFVSSEVKIVPTPVLMTGSADFQITIDSHARTETGDGVSASKLPTPTPPSAQPPLPKPDDTKPKLPGKTNAPPPEE